jgi:Na+-translocating ferredoxin:NAD+ oxidoreductase subunit G
MKDAPRMIALLASITTLCALLLSGMNQATVERIALQKLVYIQGPAIKKVLKGVDNDPLAEREKMAIDGDTITVFPGKKDGSLKVVAYETAGKGYGGEVGVITGFDLATGNCIGIAIAESRETPGIGSRVNAGSFCELFLKITSSAAVALKKDGGSIDGISGATISSRAVCGAVNEACKLFSKVRNTLGENGK